MTGYIIRRLFQSAIVVLLVTLLVFSLIHLVPGDPVLQILGPYAEKDTIAQLRQQLRLDEPVPQQYLTWLSHVVRGDLGDSLISQKPVGKTLEQRIPITAQLALGAWVLSLGIGVPAGIIAALWRNKWPDYASSVAAVTGAAVPSFWLAILLIIVLSVWLKVLPTGGWVKPTVNFGASIKRCIMPWVVGGFGGAAMMMRQTRSGLLEVLRQDYIRTARAKGLAQRVVISRHALKNGLIPVVTLLGLSLGHLLGGAVIMEVVFGIPGMGRLMVDALWAKDYPVVQGVVLVVGVSVVLANLLVDLAYGWLDPRIRYT